MTEAVRDAVREVINRDEWEHDDLDALSDAIIEALGPHFAAREAAAVASAVLAERARLNEEMPPNPLEAITERMLANKEAAVPGKRNTLSATVDGRRIQTEMTEEESQAVEDWFALADQRQATRMPDEHSAIGLMFDAFDRLRKLGWREAIYCPKDGSFFEVIEAGSTGIFRCHYQGDWPDGSWWIDEDGGTPSHPILFRLYPEDEAKRLAKMEEARAKFAIRARSTQGSGK